MSIDQCRDHDNFCLKCVRPENTCYHLLVFSGLSSRQEEQVAADVVAAKEVWDREHESEAPSIDRSVGFAGLMVDRAY